MCRKMYKNGIYEVYKEDNMRSTDPDGDGFYAFFYIWSNSFSACSVSHYDCTLFYENRLVVVFMAFAVSCLE